MGLELLQPILEERPKEGEWLVRSLYLLESTSVSVTYMKNIVFLDHFKKGGCLDCVIK